MPSNPLTTTLGRIRQRLLAVGGAAGVLWMLAGALLCLIVGVWLDLLFDLPGEWRIAIVASAGLAAMLVFARVWFKAQTAGSLTALARRLDSAAGSGGQILSGLELLAAAGSAQAPSSALTTGLSSVAVNRAANLAAGVPGRAVVSARSLQRSALMLGSLALLVGAACWLLPRMAIAEWNRFRDPFGDHPPVTNTMFTIEPGDTSVVYGQGCEIRVTVVGSPVNELELVLKSLSGEEGASSADVLPMFRESDTQFRVALANVVSPTEYFVRSGSSRSGKYRIDVVTVPRIEAVSFRVTPPEYTRLPPTEGPASAAGLAGLPGTKVLASVRSNRPLSGGKLDYVKQQGRTEIAMTVSDASPETVTGEFSISESGRIELKVADIAGQSSTDSFATAVTVLVDERPFLRLMEPKSTSLASPTAMIPVVVSAEDDYGISRLQVFRSLNDSTFLPLDLPLASAAPRTAFQVVPLPLASYGVEPGDEIKVFARVVDNDPAVVSGGGETGKGTESAVAVIRIISQEEFDRLRETREGLETLMSKYQQVRRRLEAVANDLEEQEQNAADKPGKEMADEESRNELEKLARKLGEEAEMLRKIREERQSFPIDKELAEQLLRQQENLQRLMKEIDNLAEKENLTNEEIQEQLKELREQLRGERERLDREVMQPIEHMAKVFPLKQDEAKFARLYHRQRDLAERLSSLKGRDDTDDPAMKARMRDLEEEQRQIHSEMESLLAEIEEHALQLPEEESFDELRESAMKFAKDVRDSGADEAMTEAETGLAEFSGRRGHAGAKQAADILEKFLQKSESMGGQAAGGMAKRFQPGLSDALQQTMNQLLMNMGLGMGDGSGDGSSTRQNTMDNVGLYGSDPMSRDPSQQAGLGDRRRNARGNQGNGSSSADGSGDHAGGPPLGQGIRSTGGGEALTPLRYRRQVGRYFQRLADELGDQ